MHKLDNKRLNDFVVAIAKGRTVIAPEKSSSTPSSESSKEQYHLTRADAWDPDKHTLAPYRPVEPLKALVFPPRERVGFVGGDVEVPAIGERVVIGVKNCDLSALKIHDYVFLDTEPVDPFRSSVFRWRLLSDCRCWPGCFPELR